MRTMLSSWVERIRLAGRLPYWLFSFFVILGSKLYLIGRYGPRHPFSDQWMACGQVIYQPMLHGTLTFTDFFVPQNEHRVFLTRVCNLALLLLNQQGDCRIQMIFNAGIHICLAYM